MKIRNGFVSNSSSSSFIISYKAPEKCKCCGRSDPDLLSIIKEAENNSPYGDTKINAIGKENIIQEIKTYWDDSETTDKLIEEINNIDDNDIIICVNIAYGLDYLTDMIEERKMNRAIKVHCQNN